MTSAAPPDVFAFISNPSMKENSDLKRGVQQKIGC